MSKYVFFLFFLYCISALPGKAENPEIIRCSEAANAFQQGNYAEAYQKTSGQLCPKLRMLARWQQLMKRQNVAGQTKLTFHDYLSFAATAKNLPFQKEFRTQAEYFLVADTGAKDIQKIFGQDVPVTKRGIEVILSNSNRSQLSKVQLKKLWLSPNLSESQEKIIATLIGDLTITDVEDRFWMLLTKNQTQAQNFLNQFQIFYQKDLILNKKTRARQNAKTLFHDLQVVVDIARTPDQCCQMIPYISAHGMSNQKILVFCLKHLVAYEDRMHENQGKESHKDLNKDRPQTKKTELTVWSFLKKYKSVIAQHSDVFWRQIHIAARDAITQKQYQKTVDILSLFSFSQSKAITQQQFLKGLICFQFLNAPEKALAAFQEGAKAATQPNTKAKFSYWQGKALQNLGRTQEAIQHFEAGTRFAQTFYGQLSFQALNKPFRTTFMATRIDEASFAKVKTHRNSEVALLLKALDHDHLIAAFLYRLYYSLKSNKEKSALVEFCHRHLPDFTHDMSRLWGVVYHDPRTYRFVEGVNAFPDPHFLLAIIRKESGFYERAKSPAGACGLMQVMPETALKVLSEPISKEAKNAMSKRLRYDPQLNIEIGAKYVFTQLERFQGDKDIMLAGYNAGPLYAFKWIDRYGDPRQHNRNQTNSLQIATDQNGEEEVALLNRLVWIELIPYEETRNYVKSVRANEFVYRHLSDSIGVNR